MTAVIGVLNKQAVAIAADSAVTVSGGYGTKVMNTANKIFTLSKYHPVGIMIYNEATFMGTPWETIIKIYREKLGKTSFSTVEAYQQDFIKYLKEQNFYTNTETKEIYLYNFLEPAFRYFIDEASKILQENMTDEEISTEIEVFIVSFLDDYLLNNKDYLKCVDFEKYEFVVFEKDSINVINSLLTNFFYESGYKLKQQTIDKIKQFCYLFFGQSNLYNPYTGLVFIGFGELEIYPSLVPINVSFAIGNYLKYFIDFQNKASINQNTITSAIIPFAQTDVIQTILTGIAPQLESQYLNVFGDYFDKYNQVILQMIGQQNPDLARLFQSIDIDKFKDEYNKKIQEIKQIEFINPLLQTVSLLSKEDLAEMAESLIYLTYLKRRMTSAQESVGGPVDVAIISKGDGFIWIKRKHYFKPELNQHFFQNYLNNSGL